MDIHEAYEANKDKVFSFHPMTSGNTGQKYYCIVYHETILVKFEPTEEGFQAALEFLDVANRVSVHLI